MSKLKIGIVGCGAIGSSLAKAIAKDFKKEAEISALFDIIPEKSIRLSMLISMKSLSVKTLSALIKKCDLVIESSSAKFSFSIAREVLKAGKSIMVMSVGGISGRCAGLRALAKKNNSRVYIPSGAISGIDALKAASLSKIKSVTLTTRKNPLAFKGVEYVAKKGIVLNRIKKDTVLFSGNAARAVKYFPQNINVASVLGIAGIGALKTKIKIIASPSTKKNIHEIRIESKAADVFTRTENIVHPENQKTSYLAVLSALATLRQILEPVKIGT